MIIGHCISDFVTDLFLLIQPLINRKCQTHIFNHTKTPYDSMSQGEQDLQTRIYSSTLKNHTVQILRDNEMFHEKL